VGSFAPDSSKVNESRTVSFSLAHFSDAHLPNTSIGDVFSNFSGKRLIGGASWFLRRRKNHLFVVANAIRDDILKNNPDHIAYTGDVVNIAAQNEFPAAAAWLKKFGPADKLTFVPGNHDAYVSVPRDKSLAHFEPWMQSDRQDNGASQIFPILRLRRTIALIGLSSSQPQSYTRAAGTLGPEQRRDLGHMLSRLGQQGFYRVVLIHHPPLPALAPDRKALTDAEELKTVLENAGCELVLHGHNHISMLNWVQTKAGPAPVVGVPSASFNGTSTHEAAGWNLFHIRRHQGRWLTDMTKHSWQNTSQTMRPAQTVTLSPP
jgi:3',5'-cyclic AMP phosphodiesterase CpdA